MIDFEEACAALCGFCRGGITPRNKPAVNVYTGQEWSSWSHWVEPVDSTPDDPNPRPKETKSYIDASVFPCAAYKLRDSFKDS